MKSTKAIVGILFVLTFYTLESYGEDDTNNISYIFYASPDNYGQMLVDLDYHTLPYPGYTGDPSTNSIQGVVCPYNVTCYSEYYGWYFESNYTFYAETCYLSWGTNSCSTNFCSEAEARRKYTCLGWTNGMGDFEFASTSNSFFISEITTNSALTWLWLEEFKISKTNAFTNAFPDCPYDFDISSPDEDGDEWYTNGTPITLTAADTNEYWQFEYFVSFTNGITNAIYTNQTTTINVTNTASYAVLYTPYFYFSVDGNPVEKGNPEPYGYGNFKTYGTITNTVEEFIETNGTKYTCTGWEGSGSISTNLTGGNEIVFTITNDSTLTWQWNTEYWLFVDDDGNGNIGTIGYGWKDSGAQFQITATPNTNYLFSHWSGDVPPANTNDNPLSIIMNQPRTIMANFKLNPDQDTDNIEDSWEITHFGSTTNCDETTDYDSDGMLDWEEFIAGTCPTNDSSLLTIENTFLPDDSNSFGLAWQSVTGKSYTIYVKTNITDLNWQEVTNLVGDGEIMQFFDSIEYENAFYSLSVSN